MGGMRTVINRDGTTMRIIGGEGGSYAIIGIDIGQKHDPTAIAVMELEWRTAEGSRDDHYLGRHIERLPLGTTYPAIAARLKEVVTNVKARGVSVAHVYVDATGVGMPVVDVLKAAGVPITPVYFTHGDRRTVNEDHSVTLGKAFLVSRLKALMQTGRIHLTQSAEMDAMQKELMDYEIRVDEQANDRYGAFRVGTHDDLVTALGLAVQGKPPTPGVYVIGGERPVWRPYPGGMPSRGGWQ